LTPRKIQDLDIIENGIFDYDTISDQEDLYDNDAYGYWYFSEIGSGDDD
jgi:hypothetical protein